VTGRLLLWLVLGWPAPALIAGALGWKGVWGSGSAVTDYLIPIPVAGGAFHAMTFIAITVLLTTQPRWPELLRGIAHLVLFGISVTGALLVYDLERRRLVENPVGLFLLTDSLIAQLFVPAFGGRAPENGKEWGLGLVAACLIPAASAASLHQLDPRTGQQFAYVTSKPGQARGDHSYLVHSRIKVHAPEFKPAAEAYAQQWHPRLNINDEDIAVHFFAGLPAAQIGNEHEASLTYCMFQDGTPSYWVAGKGDCFDHETVTERAQKLFEAQPSSVPVDERVRIARAKACEGVRVPEEFNAIHSLCKRN
jgi:hypothetical protein